MRGMAVRQRNQALRLKSDAGPMRPNTCCVAGVRDRFPPGPPPGRRPEHVTEVTGTVTYLNYNADVDGRGLCVQTDPQVPRRYGGWACLWKDNALYHETTALLHEAARHGDACLIRWRDRRRQGNAEIFMAECQPAAGR